MDKPSHLDEQGRARMVDVGPKSPVPRRAVAEGFLRASAKTLDMLEAGELPKGEALATARIAGIQAAKRCDELIPLCHPLPLEMVSVDFGRAEPQGLRIEAAVSTTAKTGVEMEALVAVTVAALTLYDMAKAVDKDLRIEGIRLVSKTKEEGTEARKPSVPNPNPGCPR
ncbi:MAG: cyclic pyranopterin monophosphate synthase MoaC [Planctomycetota bacterium]|jgi:cyclic pyranopterin phosphate synthase